MDYDLVLEENLEAELFTLLEVGDKYEYNWESITKWLNTEFKVDPLEGIGLTFSDEKVYKLLNILKTINSKFSWYNSLDIPVRECLTETLKLLRVYVTVEEVARYLLNYPMFYMVMKNLLECIFTKKNGEELFTKYLLQLMLNLLSVGSEQQRTEAKEKIRKYFYGEFYRYFMGAYGCMYEISAIVYNLFSDADLRNEGLVNHIILYHGDKHKVNEYLDFLMEKLISTDFLWQMYEELNPKTRLTLLSCLREVLICPNYETLLIKVKILPISCLERFVVVFNKSTSVVFQVSQAGCTNASQEVSYILELLSHASSEETSLQYLQNSNDTFINAGVLLLNIHRLGQMPDNIFTPIQKLAQNEEQHGEERNPVFGFKVDLVRLIGNFCWKNRKMQDLAREAEVIPVLLDCCNIDEKNPFIIQWVIFAIRNICENNRENQAVIAGLTQQGVINANTLQQFGLTLHAEEDLHVGIIEIAQVQFGETNEYSMEKIIMDHFRYAANRLKKQKK